MRSQSGEANVAESDNKLTAGSAAEAAGSPSAQRAVASSPAEARGDPGTALVVRGEGDKEDPVDPGRDTRLDRLPMQLDVMVRLRSLRVADLLSLTQGSVVETVHDHGQDVPLCCGGTLLLWGEFEMVEQRLALRITRLA